MKHRNTYTIIVLALAALTAVFFWQRRFAPKRFDWRESGTVNAYNEQSGQPYGTQIFYRLLDSYFPDYPLANIRESIAAELPAEENTGTYVFVGEALFTDSTDIQRLLDFVAAGNTAFISSKTIPPELMSRLYSPSCGQTKWRAYNSRPENRVDVSLRQPTTEKPASLHYAKQNKPSTYFWNYMGSSFFCDLAPHRALGYLNGNLVNFAEFPHGAGRFLLHTTPIAFTNYLLLRPEPRRYAEAVLANLPEGTIYWDQCSRLPEKLARRFDRGGSASNRQLPVKHSFSYLLQQPPLAWAWYLLMALAGLYIIFRAKRRQRVIPVLPKNENASYAFISTIAQLHFREKNYQNLCVQHMRLFLAQLRDRYGLTAQLDADTLKPRIDAAFFQRLAQVSEVPLKQIQDIFTQYQATVQYEPTEDMMIELHRAMERFFKQAK